MPIKKQRSTIYLLSAIVVFGLLFIPSFAKAAPYYVATSGADTNSGTISAPFKTIQKGMTPLKPGDTLYIRAGEYHESIGPELPFDNSAATSWSQAITIAAYNAETVIIKPPPSAKPTLAVAYFFYTKHKYIILDGLILDGTNVFRDGVDISPESDTHDPAAAIPHYIWIKNTTIRNAPSMGVYTGTGENIFSNIDVYHNGFNCPSTPTDLCHGLYLSSNNNILEYSKVHDNSGWGLQVYTGWGFQLSNNIIRYNLVYDNAAAGLRGTGIGLYSGPGHQAYGNIVWGNKYGLVLNYGAADAVVHDNTIYKNAGSQGNGLPILDNGINTTNYNNTLINKDAPDVIPSIPSAPTAPAAPRNLRALP